jgi:prepilin-type N-terminal cleavage/methylation domain-containing protein
MRPLSTSIKRPGRGFTLVEMVVAITVFALVVLATVAVQIYAMRVYTLAATKLNASEQSRVAMNDIRDTIREARVVYVGTYATNESTSVMGFTPLTNDVSQVGNALMIYPTTDTTNNFTLAYVGASPTLMPPSANSFYVLVYTNGEMVLSNDVADYITNQVAFDAENFEGSILTNNQNNYLIRMTLDFSQWEQSLALAGAGSNAYDYYQISTVVTRRDTD